MEERLSQLGVLRPSVLLEVGNARVTPFVVCSHSAIESMFWGPRLDIDVACATIRAWIAQFVPQRRLQVSTYFWVDRVRSKAYNEV